MKRSFLIAATFVFSTIAFSLNAQKITMDSVMQKVAKGKPFVLCILTTGKPLPADQARVSKMQSEHLINLFQLENDKKVSIFGPVTTENSNVRGIIIFNNPDIESAKKELDADPYIKEGYMKYELYNWFSIPGQSIPIN